MLEVAVEEVVGDSPIVSVSESSGDVDILGTALKIVSPEFGPLVISDAAKAHSPISCVTVVNNVSSTIEPE
jgi:hypothetical protein